MSTIKRYCCHKPSTLIYRTDQDDELEGRTTANDADGDHVIIRTNARCSTCGRSRTASQSRWIGVSRSARTNEYVHTKRRVAALE
jgi:hypothetical protein